MHVGFPIFELNKFTEEEKWSIKHNDRIFVCSEWAKQIVEHDTKVNARVVPLGVDTDIFLPSESTRSQTIFFNCGKWEIRKGHDILVDCFNSAFGHEDNVELWMMCDNPFYSQEQQQEWINLYKNSNLGSKIRIIPRQKDHKGVYEIMKQADCGVFPSRAEGWNLELLEMMACGKHVIATDYSAHTEFCNSQNCRLVEIDSLELANDGIWFNGQGMWANIKNTQIEAIVDHMRDIHSIKQRGELGQNTDGILTARDLSWENSAEKFSDSLN
jgi:glycosyltransferase involved in cell wall biosynthesis